MAQTYSAICASLLYLPVFSQNLLAQINLNFEPVTFTGLTDAKNYPTNDSMILLVPLMGPVTCDLQIKVYCISKFFVDNCRRALGLSVPPTLTMY
jgi:hypothetical protein